MLLAITYDILPTWNPPFLLLLLHDEPPTDKLLQLPLSLESTGRRKSRHDKALHTKIPTDLQHHRPTADEEHRVSVSMATKRSRGAQAQE